MRVGIGQDSHRFDFEDHTKELILGGVKFPGHAPLKGNSDADVVLHSLTNAISGVTGVNILGSVSDEMCLKHGIKDSSLYLKEALKHLGEKKVIHVSISIECMTPQITPRIPEMRSKIASLLDIPEDCVGITATSGEGLSEFGRGKGIQVLSVVTVT